MLVDEYLDLTEDSLATIHTAHYNHHKYIHKMGKYLTIDYRALLRRREFNKRIWLEAHTNYYTLHNSLSDTEQSIILAKQFDRTEPVWGNFLRYGLFSLAQLERSLLAYEVNTMLWEYWKASRSLIRNKR